MNKHHESTGRAGEQQITLRGPAELADALPYLMGFYPNDSVVMVALHGGQGRFGGRLRLGIPQSPGEWGPVADQLADCLVSESERREGRPDAIVIFLCQDSPDGSGGRLAWSGSGLSRNACARRAEHSTFPSSKRSASPTVGTGPTVARTPGAVPTRETRWPCRARR